MGMIIKRLIPPNSKIDWPVENSKIIIENNIGDKEPIHIHFKPPNTKCGLALRIHFTYDEFREFSEKIIKAGKL